MIKGYKIRIYPTKEQECKMWQHIGACRYIYNYMLELQKSNYSQGGKFLSAFSMMGLLKPLKNDGNHAWLYNVSNKSLQITCRHLADAYIGFFKNRCGHPKFKSKKGQFQTFLLIPKSFILKMNHF